MKTKLHIILFIIGLSISLSSAFGQCTPDPTCTDPEGDGQFCPTEFPNAVESIFYEQTLTIIMPEQVQGINIHHIDLLNINNIPPGMSYQCQNNNCSFFPTTPKCVSVFGTPEIGSWGEYRLYLTLEVFMDVAGFPVSIGEITDSTAMVTIEAYLHADFEIEGNTGMICYDNIYQVTYTGNASTEGNYNWNFGENLTVISGEGAGPYEIIYDQANLEGIDSISLVVSEGDYISPTFKVEYYEGICESTHETNEFATHFYPNPFKEFLYINSSSNEQTDVFISDISGKIVYETIIDNASAKKLDLSQLHNGIYFINLRGTSNTNTYKIIKQ